MKIRINPGFVSQHFDDNEFRCPCCNKVITISPELVYNLELLRAYYKDKPIVISSGYRCKKYNSSLPGSSAISGHMFGRAADIYIKGVKPDAIVKRWKKQLGSEGYSYTNNKNMKGVAHVEVL